MNKLMFLLGRELREIVDVEICIMTCMRYTEDDYNLIMKTRLREIVNDIVRAKWTNLWLGWTLFEDVENVEFIE